MVPLMKPPYEQVVTLQPALVACEVTLPSMRLLLLHCMLEHDAAKEEGVQ